MKLSPATIAMAVASSLAIAASAAFAAPVAYVVDSDNPNNLEKLHRVDLATGESTVVGPVDSNYSDIEGLVLTTDGRLLGVDDGSKSMFQFDLANAAITAYGGLRGSLNPTLPLGTGVDPNLALTCDGQLLMGTGTGRLYRIDTDTGRPTQIGNGATLPFEIADIAVRGDEVYAVSKTQLLRINVGNATAQVVSNFDSDLFPSGGGLAFDAEGQLWAIADRAPNPSPIYRINLLTGVATRMGSTPLPGIESMAIAPAKCSATPSQVVPTPIPASGSVSLSILGLITGLLGALALLRRR